MKIVKMMKMKVKSKGQYDNDIYTVYNVRDDKTGYPHFLIYINRQWRYISAKHFMPVEEDE